MSLYLDKFPCALEVPPHNLFFVTSLIVDFECYSFLSSLCFLLI